MMCSATDRTVGDGWRHDDGAAVCHGRLEPSEVRGDGELRVGRVGRPGWQRFFDNSVPDGGHGGPGVARISADGTEAWLLTDHLGSVVGVTDGGGSLVDQVVYDAFGNITRRATPR